MKKPLALLALFVLLVNILNAQEVRVAPISGLNIAKYGFNADGVSISNQSVTAIHAGVLLEKPLGHSFYLMPALQYSRKGAKWSYYQNIALANVTESVSYIELPLNLGYRLGAAKSLFVFAGPYMSYAINVRRTTQVGPITDDQEVQFGNEKGMYKRLDLGFSLGAGYELPIGFFFRVQYGQGLSNMVAEGDKDNMIKHQVIGVSVGYFVRRTK